jgi:hypothetical protein
LGFRFKGWGSKIQDSGFRVQGLGKRVLGFRFWGLSLKFGFRVWGVGFRVQSSEVKVLRFRV